MPGYDIKRLPPMVMIILGYALTILTILLAAFMLFALFIVIRFCLVQLPQLALSLTAQCKQSSRQTAKAVLMAQQKFVCQLRISERRQANRLSSLTQRQVIIM